MKILRTTNTNKTRKVKKNLTFTEGNEEMHKKERGKVETITNQEHL